MISPVTILLLDAEPLLRRATALMLANRGGEVTAAATPAEALRLSWRRVYDVAVLDVAPGGPGAAELLQSAREQGFSVERVIAVSSEPLDRREAAPFAGVLRKPYRFELLLAAVFGRPRRAARTASLPRLRAQGARRRPTPRPGARRGPRPQVGALLVIGAMMGATPRAPRGRLRVVRARLGRARSRAAARTR